MDKAMTRLRNRELIIRDQLTEAEEKLVEVTEEIYAYIRDCEHEWGEPVRYEDLTDGYYKKADKLVWWRRECVNCGIAQVTEFMSPEQAEHPPRFTRER